MKIVRAIDRKTGAVHRRVAPGRYEVTPGKSIKSASAYSGAMVTRLTEDWPIQILSADGATRWALRQLRARARDKERNGGIHERYLCAVEANVIGSQGIGIQMKVREASDRIVTDPAEQTFLKALQEKELAVVRKMQASFKAHGLDPASIKVPRLFELKGDQMLVAQGQLDRYACALIEQEWAAWGKRGAFDVTAKHSRHDWWRIALRTSARDGDALGIRYRGFPNKWGTAWQLIEGDYCDDYYNLDLPNGNTIRMGIEQDLLRRKVAAWVFTKHPGDYGIEGFASYDGRRQRIPFLGTEPNASVHVLHLSRSKRAEETRAVPWITPAMMSIQMLDGYEDAEITAARAEACKHVFYERDLFASDGSRLEYEELPTGQLVDDIEPGGATELPPGVKANVYDPKHPNTAYPEFVKSVKRRISAALNCAYNTLFVDLESVNYSSIRAGLLEEREGWKMTQTWFEDDTVRPQFEDWLEYQLLTGTLPFKFSDFDRLNAPEFKFRRWPWVDPEKDAQAAKILLEARLTTRSRIIADMSSEDFEDTIRELDYEEGFIAEQPNLKAAEERQASLENPAPPTGRDAVPSASSPKAPEVKSAYIGDCALEDLPDEVQRTVEQFQPDADPDAKVTRYQMTVPELLGKVDQHNYETAKKHAKRLTIAEAGDIVRGRPDKHILLLNDRIIDGHHHLAKAEKGKITSSLPVLDLSPLRHQATD